MSASFGAIGPGAVRPRQRAFTLVELLVVIGIIALLVGILMPALARARQAAQSAACLANLHSIGQAVAMYRSESQRIPFFFILRNAPWTPVAVNGTGNALWWTAFSQGGKTTHPSITIGYMDDHDKPLNGYLYKSMYPDLWTGVKAAADERPARNVFRCPADTMNNSSVGVPYNYLGTAVPSPYELYGTSYPCNRGWMYDADIIDVVNKYASAPLTYARVDGLNKAISRIVARWDSTKTYVCTDMPFLWSVFYSKAVPGAHSRRSVHNALFLDGHATTIEITATDVARWNTYSAGRYTPKSGDGWYDGKNINRYGNLDKNVPYNNNDPFNTGTSQSSYAGTRDTIP